MIQILTWREADFNHFIRLREQLVVAAQNFRSDRHLSVVQIPRNFKDRTIQVSSQSTLSCGPNKRSGFSESAVLQRRQARELIKSKYPQGRRRTKNFKKRLCDQYYLTVFFNPFEVMNFVSDGVIANQSNCNVP